MTDPSPTNRCRIVLIAPEHAVPETFEAQLRAAMSGGDIASLILPQFDAGEQAFQVMAERIVPIAQENDIAVIIAGDTRIASRVSADGVHMEAGKQALAETIERLQGKMMVGAGGAKTRDDALELGETRPDYMFFGRFGYDRVADPHPRNLALAGWWAQMIEIPCIVLGGSDVASVETACATGAEFVALSAGVFGPGIDAADAVARANDILDRTAARFEE